MTKRMLNLDALSVESFATTLSVQATANESAWSDGSVCPGTTTTGATARCPF